MSNNILTINRLNKSYQTIDEEITALENITLEVKDQEFITIVGPSGSGKSTILSILNGLTKQSKGTFTFNKKDPVIGYMLQSDALFPWLTVLENALLGLSIKGKIKNEDKIKVENLLNKYGLKSFKNTYPDNLSGGMRQRVALIRTLALDPDILLLDEPFSALDYQTRLTLSDDLLKIIKEEKKTAVMVTHDIAEAISMSDRIVVLTKRPSKIKNIYNIELEIKDTPTNNRKDKKFAFYYDIIWKDLEKHV